MVYVHLRGCRRRLVCQYTDIESGLLGVKCFHNMFCLVKFMT